MDSKKIFELKQEIQRLLKERPEYIPLQKKIEERMKGAINQNNRLTIIRDMMMDSFMEMNESLKQLSDQSQILQAQANKLKKPD